MGAQRERLAVQRPLAGVRASNVAMARARGVGIDYFRDESDAGFGCRSVREGGR